jgi:integrase
MLFVLKKGTKHMRYIALAKSGNWYFRYQIPPQYRHLFDNRYEVKQSLRTSSKQDAMIKSLQIELEIRTSIKNNMPLSQSKSVEHKHNNTSQKLQQTPSASPDPFNCLDKYKESKRDLVSPKTLEMAYAKCFTVLTLLSKKGIKEIRRLDAEEARSLLTQYPANAKKFKEFDGLKGKQLIKANKKHNKPTLSPESVKDYAQKCSSFFEWCLQMEMTDVNPFKGMKFRKARKDSDAKHAYSKEDLGKLFSTEIHTQRKYKHPYYYWLPILGSLTGARLNELCQLYKQDIYQIDGIWVLKIDDGFAGQKLKNNFSKRIIPIHNKIIELGFIDYLNSVPSERVFPELKEARDGFGTAASKWFGRFKSKLGFERGYDYHSFRHTVANQFKQLSIPQIKAAEILGHAQNSITYDRYGKQIEVQNLVDVINCLSVDHLPN